MTDARLHFHTLRGAGWSLRAIAAHADVSIGSLCRWRDGLDLPHVDHGISSIDPLSIPERTTGTRLRTTAEPFVPRIGTVRRLRALMRLGWPAREINTHLHRLGITDRRAAENLLNQPGRWVLRSRHDAVATVYRDLCTTPGPSTLARRHAEKNGYPGPMDWDDIDHDEAPQKPDDLCVTDGCIATAQWVYDGTFTEARVLCSRCTKAGAAA